ncbi:thyrotropin-releasing hormone receptor-like [Brachionus plicatilis]|uniref:Thyrotropin-releasing hormone receptor-like n=1 Tax=Brachionus plicatilis TaxID=10195 RepID=A0A3M7S8G4_BRAPC|nr:thyrotropin-releasing hormone receptor-like [Brachionus plicatilis]
MNGTMSEQTLPNKHKNNYFHSIESVNFYACGVIIILGLLGNVVTIYLVKSRPSASRTKRSFSIYQRRFNLSSISSSDMYMISLAFSDSLFLLAHFVEDIVPSMDKNIQWLQFINKSNLVCKLVLFVRNAARLSSSYLIVLFAYERFSCISAPLKRLKFHNRKYLIVTIFVASCLLTSYTFLLNGLRSTENHESSVVLYECDVLSQFKFVYKYTIMVYTTLGIIIPIVLVCIFNLYIARVLFKRKNRMIKNFGHTGLSNCSSSIQIKTDTVQDYDPVGASSKSHCLKVNSVELGPKRTAPSYFDLRKNNLYQFSGIAQRLKDSGRATVILVFLSVFFVLLNFPYIVSWCFFFIPYQSGLLKDQDQILFRYAFVMLAEIFHMTNYSVNFALCCMASKKFRLKFKERFFRLKFFEIKFYCYNK